MQREANNDLQGTQLDSLNTMECDWYRPTSRTGTICILSGSTGPHRSIYLGTVHYSSDPTLRLAKLLRAEETFVSHKVNIITQPGQYRSLLDQGIERERKKPRSNFRGPTDACPMFSYRPQYRASQPASRQVGTASKASSTKQSPPRGWKLTATDVTNLSAYANDKNNRPVLHKTY